MLRRHFAIFRVHAIASVMPLRRAATLAPAFAADATLSPALMLPHYYAIISATLPPFMPLRALFFVIILIIFACRHAFC